MARGPARRSTSRRSARSPRGSRCRSRSPAASRRPTGSGSRSPPARRASSWRWRRRRSGRCSPTASRSPATGWRSASTRAPSGSPPSRGDAAGAADPRRQLVGELAGPRRPPLRAGPWRSRAGPRAAGRASLGRTMQTSSSPAGRPTSTAIRRLRDAGVAGIILGQALLSGAIDFRRPGGRRMTRSARLLVVVAASPRPLGRRACGPGGRRLRAPRLRAASTPRRRPAVAAATACPTAQPAARRPARSGSSRSRPRRARSRSRSRPTSRRSRPATSSPSQRAASTTASSSTAWRRSRRDAVRHPGRRPDRDRDRRARLHDHRTSRSRRPYQRGTVAMARTAAPNSVGSPVLHRARRRGREGLAPGTTPTRSSGR